VIIITHSTLDLSTSVYLEAPSLLPEAITWKRISKVERNILTRWNVPWERADVGSK